MKQIPSAEFRRSYATLTEPVEVTALGRVIGRYVPISAAIDDRVPAGIRPGEPAEKPFTDFRPAPKPGKRK